MKFYKKHSTDKIWWVDWGDSVGNPRFSFDKEKIYDVFGDYPHNLNKEQKEIFDKENKWWADYLNSR